MFWDFHNTLSSLLNSLLHEEKGASSRIPNTKAKKGDWHFIVPLVYSQNYFRRSSAFNIIYSLEREFAEPEQLTEKIMLLGKDTHIHTLYSQFSACRAQ